MWAGLLTAVEKTVGFKLTAHSRFGDVSTDSLSFDTIRMICGYGVMFVYVILMLGKLNRVEHRTYLAIAGLVAVLFGIVISMGMAFQLGYFYTPLHGLLPFLALGKGKFLKSQWGIIRL